MEPTAKLVSAKADRSTTGFFRENARQKVTTPPTTMTMNRTATISSSNQSLPGPSSSTNSIAPRKQASAPRPIQSKESNSFQSGLSKSTSASTPTVTAMPAGTLTRNSQCQLSAWLR